MSEMTKEILQNVAFYLLMVIFVWGMCALAATEQ